MALDKPQKDQSLGTGDPDLAIETQGLSLWYGAFQALYDVNLSVKKGKITSLIGPSGCGKSTLLRCINRINERLGYVRTEGSVKVLGHNVLDDDVALPQLRKQVGMVFQRTEPPAYLNPGQRAFWLQAAYARQGTQE